VPKILNFEELKTRITILLQFFEAISPSDSNENILATSGDRNLIDRDARIRSTHRAR
jgi:hypothetical protein